MLIYVMVKVNDSDHKICTDQIVKPTDHSQVPGVIELYHHYYTGGVILYNESLVNNSRVLCMRVCS